MNKLSKTLALSLATLTLAGSSTPIFAARASKKVDDITIPRHRAAATETNGRTGEAVSTPRDRGARPERANAIVQPLGLDGAMNLFGSLQRAIKIIHSAPRGTQITSYTHARAAQYIINQMRNINNDDLFASLLQTADSIVSGYLINNDINRNDATVRYNITRAFERFEELLILNKNCVDDFSIVVSDHRDLIEYTYLMNIGWYSRLSEILLEMLDAINAENREIVNEYFEEVLAFIR